MEITGIETPHPTNRSRISKQEKIDRGMSATIDYARQGYIPPRLLRRGSLAGRIRIALNDPNHTEIYVRPGSNVRAIREKYLKHVNMFRFDDSPTPDEDLQ